LNAQSETQLEATYNCIKNNKTNTGILKVDGNKSLFTYDNDLNETNKSVSEKNNSYGRKEFNFSFQAGDSIGIKYYISLNEKLLISRELLFKDMNTTPYVVHESLKKIPWNIKEEFKKIGKYRCQKAVGIFRGRQYIAWFNPEIPVNFGPWKLHGLPGLIMEAYDQGKFAIFQIESLEFKSNEKLDIKPPKNGKEISLERFVQLRKKQVEDLQNHIQSKLPRGAHFNINSVSYNYLEKTFDFQNKKIGK
jgi:GLPGLI family protein